MNLATNLGVSMITGLFDSDPNSASSVKRRAPYELRVGPFVNYELEVLSFRGKERVNDVYRYEVTFATEVDEDTLHAALFGATGCLTIKAPGYDPRVIQGLVASIEGLGGVPSEQGTLRRRYRLLLVPKLWLMKHRRKNRVFQHKSAVDIATLMLAEVGIATSEVRWRTVDADYPARPFVYQRSESDFDFFRRVLADAGIFFYFDHSSGLLAALSSAVGAPSAEASVSVGALGVTASAAVSVGGGTTVLNFAARASDTLAVGVSGSAVSVSVGVGATDGGPSATLSFDDGMGADSGDERVYEFGLKKQLRTKALRLHERLVDSASNWVGEQTVSLHASPTASASVSASVSLGGASVSASARVGGVPFDLETTLVTSDVLRQERYEVDASLPLGQTAGSVGKPRMDLELARTRRRYIEATGKSDCRRIGAGYRFTLARHPIQALNGEYTVVSMDAEGIHPDYVTEADHVYRNRFRCIPSTYAPLPPRPKKRPKLGIEMAEVVAYSDILKVPWLESSPNGYVKVRFRWDIVDQNGASTGMLQNGVKYASGTEDNFAIWVPVMQPWAGAGYGTQFGPREGMDVIVGFLEDQGERPVILGCLYSAANAPPWADQEGSQKVGIKSQTRPSNGGYSELSIDDTQGKEVVTIIAQTDLAESVLHDRTTTIGNNDTVTVSHERTTSIGSDDTLTVAGSASQTITGDDTTAVAGDATSTIGGTLTASVTGDVTTSVQGTTTETLQGDITRDFGGKVTAKVAGSSDHSFADDYTERHLGHRTIIVGSGDAHRAAVLHVEGTGRVYSSMSLEVEVLQGFTLVCGSSQLLVSPSGITLSSPNITLSGKEIDADAGTFAVSATDALTLAGKTVTMQTGGGKVALDSSSVNVSGSQISLGSGSGSLAPPSSAPVKVTKVQMKDAQGKPRANVRVLLTKGGKTGEQRMTVLDADGELDLVGDAQYTISFPDDPVAK